MAVLRNATSRISLVQDRTCSMSKSQASAFADSLRQKWSGDFYEQTSSDGKALGQLNDQTWDDYSHGISGPILSQACGILEGADGIRRLVKLESSHGRA